MFDFWRWQGLRKRVGDHFGGRAIDESNLAFLDDPANEMVPHVDVFHAQVIPVVLSERDGGLVVRV